MSSVSSSVRSAVSRAVSMLSPRRAGRHPDSGRRNPPPRTRPVPAGVRIEYSPEIDGDPDPGEIVWTWVPYEDDPTRGKDRPVVIIGRIGDDLAGVPLTSKDRGRPDEVPVGTGAWDRSGRPSFAKVDQLLTIDPDAIRREGAVLARDHFDDVVAGVGEHHDNGRPPEV